MELSQILAESAKHCDILRRAAEAGGLLMDAMINIQDNSREKLVRTPLLVVENGCGSLCIDLRQANSELAALAKDANCAMAAYLETTYHS
nr:pantothenate kinase 2 isoform X1 [Tanacetum cinerariifolium]